jgi:alpha-amylase
VTAVVFYFQVHQPYRIARHGSGSDVARDGAPEAWFDQRENRRILERVAERGYRATNAVLKRCLEEYGEDFRCAFSLSGTALTQLEDWSPETLDSFRELVDTGNVEVLCETSHHSLASLVDLEEFARQIEEHRERVEHLFGTHPTTFRNTECVISNPIAHEVERLGFDALIGEGADGLLEGRSPGHVYAVKGCRRLRLLLRNYLFSDDIAFRFSNREWESWPLLADTFAGWLGNLDPVEHEFVGLFMDYETFGEHQAADTGVLDFLEHVPRYLLENPRFRFATPREVAAELQPHGVLDIPRAVSWADAERDVSAWLGNPMQREAHTALYELGPAVRHAAAQGRPELLEAWKRLTTSDHVYYMCSKLRSDGDVHEYFTPHESPHDSFVLFMRVLEALAERLDDAPSPAPAT